MAELSAGCRLKQLQRFLESHRVEDAVLPNIGKARKQLLLVYNIEDASDVELSRIIGIKGFGPAMRSTLLAWRASIDQQFRFDPNKGVDPEDLRQLEQELRQIRVVAAPLKPLPRGGFKPIPKTLYDFFPIGILGCRIALGLAGDNGIMW
jgi:DNA-binding helix-hairpin-helix protein with protein kinase domain